MITQEMYSTAPKNKHTDTQEKYSLWARIDLLIIIHLCVLLRHFYCRFTRHPWPSLIYL